MIGRLRGTIAERAADGSIVLDVAGVGYEVFVPYGSLGRLPAPPEQVTLHVHTHVREDALVLYGFATPDDRTAFRMLLGVSNVGPKIALAVMGAMDARELASAIASQDPKRFKGMPGVGKRTVERILLDLKDKLGLSILGAAAPSAGAVSRPDAPARPAGPLAQVASMLVSMGFKPSEAERAVASLDDTERPVETLLREALAHLS
ncbi:MAG: Holliday junction branch migration protein RuvA [Sandaracinaceae bacterium]|nr:Holliday junction branch migration protein RuvA [Sandaracinaceae bacterium]